MGLEHLVPYHQMPNRYHNDFGKLPKFIIENKARRTRKRCIGFLQHLAFIASGGSF